MSLVAERWPEFQLREYALRKDRCGTRLALGPRPAPATAIGDLDLSQVAGIDDRNRCEPGGSTNGIHRMNVIRSITQISRWSTVNTYCTIVVEAQKLDV